MELVINPRLNTNTTASEMSISHGTSGARMRIERKFYSDKSRNNDSWDHIQWKRQLHVLLLCDCMRSEYSPKKCRVL
jgi:hypothetical protein